MNLNYVGPKEGPEEEEDQEAAAEEGKGALVD